MQPSEDDWFDAHDMPETVRPLLEEVGRVYAPYLLANADAVERNAERVETEIAGRRWVQRPFPYQKKCLEWLRASYAGLDSSARSTVDEVIRDTGCEVLFN